MFFEHSPSASVELLDEFSKGNKQLVPDTAFTDSIPRSGSNVTQSANKLGVAWRDKGGGGQTNAIIMPTIVPPSSDIGRSVGSSSELV